MKDGEIGVLHADGRSLDLKRKQKAPDQDVKLSPAPYPHWTLTQRMLPVQYEQPRVVNTAMDRPVVSMY